MLSGDLINLDLASLQALQTAFQACLLAIATGHQNYSMAGRTFTRANLGEVTKTLGEIAFAISMKNGTIKRTVYSDMSG